MTDLVSINTYVHRYVQPTGGSSNADWTLLLLHGTGGDENDLIQLGAALLPGAGMLSPRGQVSEGGALRFFRRHAEGVLDQEDLAARTSEMARWVQTASVTYGFDSGKVIAAGFSNGANLATSMLLRGVDVPRIAVLLSPMLPFTPELLPDLQGRSVFIGAGRVDPLVSIEQIGQLESVLSKAGATVSTHWMNGGHGITADEVRQATVWLAEVIKEDGENAE